MGKKCNYFYPVKNEVPHEFRPLMAAYMSYFFRTSNVKTNLAEKLRNMKTMINNLLFYLHDIKPSQAERWSHNKNAMERRRLIIERVTKEDGTIMTPMEQLQFFGDLASERDHKFVVCYLFKENRPTPIGRTCRDHIGHLNLPIVVKPDGTTYMSTSVDNLFCKSKMRFCYSCNAEYENEVRHRKECKSRCIRCFKISPKGNCPSTLQIDDKIRCDKCLNTFFDKDCFEYHKDKACRWYKKCMKCFGMYNTSFEHVCYEFWCKDCSSRHPKNNKARGEHYCFINPGELRAKDFDRVLLIPFDVETSLDHNAVKNQQNPYPRPEAAEENQDVHMREEEEEEESHDVHMREEGEDQSAAAEEESEAEEGEEDLGDYIHTLENEHPHHATIPDYEPSMHRRVPIEPGENARYVGNVCYISDPVQIRQFRINMDPTYDIKNRLHTVNVATAMCRCSHCMHELNPDNYCEYCCDDEEDVGVKAWTSIPDAEGSIYVDEASGETPLDRLRDYIIEKTNNDNIREVICYSHNGARFDTHLLIRSFAKLGYPAEIMIRGLSVFQAVYQPRGEIKKRIRFLDTLKIIPVGLGAFAKTFNLDPEYAKLSFPHIANTRSMYMEERYNLLDPKYYGATGMPKKKKQEFMKKYREANRKLVASGKKWILRNEMIKYAKMDIVCLWAGYSEYVKIMNEMVREEVDKFDKPFGRNGEKAYYNVCLMGTTVASIAMYIFKLKCVKEKEIAYIGQTGYQDQTNQSQLAIKYLNYISKPGSRWKILHRNNSMTGEVKFGEIRVDGYDLDAKKVWEINGCRWHACPKCHDDESEILFDNKTVAEIRAQDSKRIQKLLDYFERNDLDIEIINVWECEINERLSRNPLMQAFFDSEPDTNPIDLRASLTGGRTGPLKMDAKRIAGEKTIAYYDICSLYPFANMSFEYFTGQPEIVTKCSAFQHPDDVPDGIIKFRCLAPVNHPLPVLPIKHDNQLIFCLCYSCMKTYCKENKNVGEKVCNHSIDERALTITCTSEEVKAAMREGYEILDVYHILKYSSKTTTLFKKYCQAFLKLKIENSMPPADFDTETGRRVFVETYKRIYGIDIDPDKCMLNPGARFIGKLYLNSLWGRFALSTDKIVKTLTDPEEYDRLWDDDTVEDLDAFEIEDGVICVTYKKSENLVNASNTNVVIAMQTTAYGRLWLYRFMKQIACCEGAEILYTDTDSIMFTHRPDVFPFQAEGVGDLLGQMVDETAVAAGDKKKVISSYCSAGAKNYRLEFINEEDEENQVPDPEIEAVIKVRGITATEQSETLLTNEAFKFDPSNVINLKTSKIGPSKDFQLWSVEAEKKFRPFCLKGLVVADKNDGVNKLYPYGWRFNLPQYQMELSEHDSTDVSEFTA